MLDKFKLKFDDLFSNRLNQDEARQLLIDLYKKGETQDEIAMAASVMRDHMISLNLDPDFQSQLIDNCGTGGDRSGSFNISTTVSIVLAACGCYVAKHGNRSVTSKSGSADMLEALGVNLTIPIERLSDVLHETGFIFMFALNHHPCMKHVMPIRKSIVHRTIFNVLGPLCNPAGVKKQLIGLFSESYLNNVMGALKLLGTESAMVVSSRDGLDEISISDITYALFLKDNRVTEMIIDPKKEGLKYYDPREISGYDAIFNANITRKLLSNKLQGAPMDIVLMNSAAALMVEGKARDFKEGIEMSREAILSGNALKKLEQIIAVTNQF